MPTWKLNIFVSAVKSRMQMEGKTAEEILATYPKLTESEKQEILNAIKSEVA